MSIQNKAVLAIAAGFLAGCQNSPPASHESSKPPVIASTEKDTPSFHWEVRPQKPVPRGPAEATGFIDDAIRNALAMPGTDPLSDERRAECEYLVIVGPYFTDEVASALALQRYLSSTPTELQQ